MANSTPHTHEMIVKPGFSDDRVLFIKYGDQASHLSTRVPFWRSRLKRRMKKMIKRHDKGSVNNPLLFAQNMQDAANRVLLERREIDSYGRTRTITSEKQEWGNTIPLFKDKESA